MGSSEWKRTEFNPECEPIDRNRSLIVARGRMRGNFNCSIDRVSPRFHSDGIGCVSMKLREFIKKKKRLAGLRLLDLIEGTRGNLTRSRSREIQSANNRERKVVRRFFEPFPDCRLATVENKRNCTLDRFSKSFRGVDCFIFALIFDSVYFFNFNLGRSHFHGMKKFF